MKKFVVGLLSLFLVTGTMTAQTGKKALSKAGKMIGKYAANTTDNAAALEEGLSLLNTAFEDSEVAANPDSYVKKGELYNSIIDAEWKVSLLNPEMPISSNDAPMVAVEAFEKALSMAEKKGTKKKAVAGLKGTEAYLNNVGVKFFETQEYGTAFDYFMRAVDAYKLISAAGGESRLDDEAVRNEHLYVTAASGYITYLEKGRELFPDDSGLLFAEINYYLQEGKLDQLTGKLKAAIEKEPENTSIYITLGNVYDQLTQKEREAGNQAKANEYFDLAMDYYNQTIEKDPSNFDAVYSQGALYYNKAAGMTEQINQLANDFTPAGTKKYDALKAEMDNQFKEALPFFEKAESMNPKDLNTLVALREIYARIDQLDKVGPLKARIEAIQAGN